MGSRDRTSYARQCPRWCTHWPGVLQEKGQLARGVIREGYADIAGTGDCAREFALVRCGLEMLAGQYPESVVIGS